MTLFTRFASITLIVGSLTACDDSKARIVTINREASGWIPASEVARPGEIIVWRNNAVPDMQLVMTDGPRVMSGNIKLGNAFEWTIPGNVLGKETGIIIHYEDAYSTSVAGTLSVMK